MNKLVIPPHYFDRSVWNCETGWSEKKYNAWLKDATKRLQVIYNMAEEADLVDPQDLYALGDIINMLSDTRIAL